MLFCCIIIAVFVGKLTIKHEDRRFEINLFLAACYGKSGFKLGIRFVVPSSLVISFRQGDAPVDDFLLPVVVLLRQRQCLFSETDGVGNLAFHKLHTRKVLVIRREVAVGNRVSAGVT